MSDEKRAILDSYKVDIVRNMAGAAEIDITKNGKNLSKEAMLSKLESVYFSKERVTASYARLGELEQVVLNRLLLREGLIPTQSLRRELLRARLVTEGRALDYGDQGFEPARQVPYANGYVGLPYPPDSIIFEDVIARLTYHGLVFSRPYQVDSQTYKLQYHPDSMLFVPESIRQFLPEPIPISPVMSDWQPDYVYEDNPFWFLRDLYLYWDFARRNEVPVLKSGLVAKRALKAINQVLVIPDRSLNDAQSETAMGRLYLLRQFLEALGLLCIKQDRLQTTAKSPLDIPAFWGLNLAEQVKQCLSVWLEFPDFQGVPDGSSDAFLAQFSKGRRVLLELLGKRPPGVWQEPDDLLEEIWIHDINFLIPGHSAVEQAQGRRTYYGNYSVGHYYGSSKQLLENLQQIERDFVDLSLTGVLLLLGLIELGRAAGHEDDANTWHAFRLTVLGRTLLCSLPEKVLHETDSGKLIVQPNFQIMAIGPVGLDVLARVDLFAEREKAEWGAVQYRLSRQSVYQAQQWGMPVETIIDFIEQVSESELPQNVRRSLDEWASYHNRIVFRSGVSLLQAASREALNGFLDNASIGNLLSRQVATDISLVKHNRSAKLATVLLAQGLLPAISGTDPEAATRSITIDPEGHIHSVYTVPNLYLRGRLARVAEEREDGTWQLTPVSVRRAGGNRERVQDLLDELGRFQRGPLPESLTQQIKAWGGYYGQAVSETLSLIEFSDPQTLAQLRKHPELKALLTPFRAGDRALVVVPTVDLAEIRRILTEFGVQVGDVLPR